MESFEIFDKFVGCNIFQLLLSLLKMAENARLGESDLLLISSKTPAPQYQPIKRKKRKGKQQKTKTELASKTNKKASALLLKPANPTPTTSGSDRSFHRDTESGIKVLRYCEVHQRRGS